MKTNIQTCLNKDGVSLAYDYGAGADPLVVFLSGFRSDMGGVKAQYIKDQCIARGQAYLLLDYAGHGQSGGDFLDGSIAAWADDALCVIDHVSKQHQSAVVMGSSMGGWIAQLVAQWRPQLIKGLIGIASAPDFTRTIWNDDLNDDQRATLVEQGVIYEPSKYGGPVPITYRLIRESEAVCILDAPRDLPIPMVLIHGKADEDVPWQRSVLLAENLPQTPVILHFIDDGDHRLSRDEDLSLLARVLLDMLSKID